MQLFVSLDSYSSRKALRRGIANPLTTVKPPRFVLNDVLDMGVVLISDSGVIQSGSDSVIIGLGKEIGDDSDRILAYGTLYPSNGSYIGSLDLGTNELRDYLASASFANLILEAESVTGGENRTILQTETVVYADAMSGNIETDYVTYPVFDAALAAKVEYSQYESDIAYLNDSDANMLDYIHSIDSYVASVDSVVGTLSGRYTTDSGSFLSNIASRVLTSSYTPFSSSVSVRLTQNEATGSDLVSRIISTSGIATGGGNLSANRTISVPSASVLETITGSSSILAVTPAGHRSALTSYVDPLIAGRSPLDFAYFDGVTGGRLHSGTTAHAALAIGTGDVTIVVPFRVESQAIASPLIVLGSSNGVGNNMIMVRTRYNNPAAIEVVGSTAWPTQTSTMMTTPMTTFFTDNMGKTGYLVLARTGTTASLWFDGNLLGAQSSANFGASLPGTVNLGLDSINRWRGLVGEPRIINRLWTQTDVDYLKSVGRVPPSDAFMGTMVAITTGSFRPGQKYRISNYVAGDDFANIGGTNVTGNEFTATGPTPTAWLNASSIIQLGSVVALDFGWVAQARGRFNSIHGIATGGVTFLPTEDTDAMVLEWSQSATGYILGGQNAHVFRAHKIDRVEAKPTTTTIPTITLRRNATSGGTPIVNAVSAGVTNGWTELDLNNTTLEGIAYDQYHIELSTPAAVSFRVFVTKR